MVYQGQSHNIHHIQEQGAGFINYWGAKRAKRMKIKMSDSGYPVFCTRRRRVSKGRERNMKSQVHNILTLEHCAFGSIQRTRADSDERPPSHYGATAKLLPVVPWRDGRPFDRRQHVYFNTMRNHKIKKKIKI